MTYETQRLEALRRARRCRLAGASAFVSGAVFVAAGLVFLALGQIMGAVSVIAGACQLPSGYSLRYVTAPRNDELAKRWAAMG